MDKRFWVGMALTVAWLCLGGYLCISMGLPSTLNEVGDFLSGFFSPLAFMWLVIGYRQQAEELKNSRQVLELQAKELHESVQQQVALVNLGKDQLNHEKDVIQQERKARLIASLPVFKFVNAGRFRQGDYLFFEVELRNHGARVTDLRFRAWQNDQIKVDTNLDVYENKSRGRVLGCANGDSYFVQMDYIDSLGVSRWERHALSVNDDSIWSEIVVGPLNPLPEMYRQ